MYYLSDMMCPRHDEYEQTAVIKILKETFNYLIRICFYFADLV